MKRFFSLIFLFACFFLHAANFFPSAEPKLVVDNRVLITINGHSISVLDVMKKMDLIFYKNYPTMAGSKPALYQFYTAQWKNVFMEMIHTELVLSDAEGKELKTPDGEVREEIESRFGPNVMKELEKTGLTYDEAFKMIKNELIMKKMTGYFVHAKAWQDVSPQDIKKSYELYCAKNPSKTSWTYQVLTIKGNKQKELAEAAYNLLKEKRKNPETLSKNFKDLEVLFPDSSIQLSDDYQVSSQEISESQKKILTSLKPNSYSPPIVQCSQNKPISRIFFLKNEEKQDPTSFNDMSSKLKDELLQKAMIDASEHYFQKLKKRYGLDDRHLIPENFEPFRLE